MKQESVAAHYDTLDVWYRALWGDHLHHGLWRDGIRDHAAATEELLRTIATAVGMKKGDRVCDVGCGYGGPARWFVRETGAKVVAVTNSPKQAAFAREAGGGVAVRLTDWLENGLPEDSFDAVVAVESISHFSEPGPAIQEMARVLKSEGSIVIATWMIGSRASGWLLDPIRRAGELHGLADEKAYRVWADAAGLEVLAVERLGAQVRRTWSVVMGRALKALVTKPELLKEAFLHPMQTCSLAFSSLRIWLAYRTGAMDYAIFKLGKVR